MSALTDAGYKAGELLVPILLGPPLGVAGAAAMLLVYSAIAGIGIGAVVASAGALVSGGTAAGVVVIVVIGGVLGLLHAACQEPAPRPGLIAVGLSYGIMIWAIGGLISRALATGVLENAAHSWRWLVACEAYGTALAAAACVRRVQSVRPVD